MNKSVPRPNHKSLSLDPQRVCKKPGLALLDKPSAWGETGDMRVWGLPDYVLAKFSRDHLKQKGGEQWRSHPKSSSDFRILSVPIQCRGKEMAPWLKHGSTVCRSELTPRTQKMQGGSGGSSVIPVPADRVRDTQSTLASKTSHIGKLWV